MVASSKRYIIPGSYLDWVGSVLPFALDAGDGLSGFTTMTAGADSSGNCANRDSTTSETESKGRDLTMLLGGRVDGRAMNLLDISQNIVDGAGGNAVHGTQSVVKLLVGWFRRIIGRITGQIRREGRQ